MSTTDYATQIVAQVTLPCGRVKYGPTACADDTTTPLRDGYEVGVLLSKPEADTEYTIDSLVADPGNLPDAAAVTSEASLSAPHASDDESVEVIAARARLQADYGPLSVADTFTFTDIQILRYEQLAVQ